MLITDVNNNRVIESNYEVLSYVYAMCLQYASGIIIVGSTLEDDDEYDEHFERYELSVANFDTKRTMQWFYDGMVE